LPAEQRDAFCFGFENDSGEDLFTLLFEANAVTPTQLAKQFGLSFEELMRVWSEMPMDNAAIAVHPVLQITLLARHCGTFAGQNPLQCVLTT
jgi:hypothetical protein